MIEKTTAYKVGDLIFRSIEEAQKEVIDNIISEAVKASGDVAQVLLDNRQQIIDALLLVSDTEKKKPRKVRSDKGKRHAIAAEKEIEALAKYAPVVEGVTVPASGKYKGK